MICVICILFTFDIAISRQRGNEERDTPPFPSYLHRDYISQPLFFTVFVFENSACLNFHYAVFLTSILSSQMTPLPGCWYVSDGWPTIGEVSLYPSWWQTAHAASSLKPSSQTLPHSPSWNMSTLPACIWKPSAKRTIPYGGLGVYINNDVGIEIFIFYHKSLPCSFKKSIFGTWISCLRRSFYVLLVTLQWVTYCIMGPGFC